MRIVATCSSSRPAKRLSTQAFAPACAATQRRRQISGSARWSPPPAARLNRKSRLPSHALAAKAGLSPFHFHRVFKAMTGVTPKAYAKAHRAVKVRQDSVRQRRTEAIYAAGYNTSSRFYENADTMLGMTPNKFRRQGSHAEIVYGIGKCSLGTILVARSDKGICALMFGDDAAELESEIKRRFIKAKSIKDDEAFSALLTNVIALADEPAKKFDMPLDIRGTLFQQKVWAALRAIPAGETASYAEVARRSAPRQRRGPWHRPARPTRSRFQIPCHCVVRSDGELSGYRWGPARKRALLDKERGDED